MAGNYPELWLARVENKLRTDDVAPWLTGIEEVAAPVEQIDNGAMTERNVIHIPSTDMDIDILINNNTYPLPVQNYVDGTIDITLAKYQTKQIPLSDDQAMGSSYKKIDNVTGLMIQGIKVSKYGHAAYNVAPTSDSANTPVLSTTGRSGKFTADGTSEIILTDGGRKLLVYKDLVDLKAKFDKQQVPAIGRRLVLCTDHWNDLLLDRSRFGDLLANYKTGDVAPMIAGFEIYQYVANPYYHAGVKLAYGAVPATGDFQGSFAFYTQNIAVKTGLTKQYFTPATIDTANQSNTLAYRHYYIVMPKKNKYLAGIISAAA